MEGNFVVNGWSVLGIEPEAEARYLGICYLMGASQNQDIILKVVIKDTLLVSFWKGLCAASSGGENTKLW